jgi:hypothetical protein
MREQADALGLSGAGAEPALTISRI